MCLKVKRSRICLVERTMVGRRVVGEMDGPCGRVWASQSQGRLSVLLGEVSHFSESVHTLSLGTRAKSHFLPLSHAPSSPHRPLQNLSRSPQG